MPTLGRAYDAAGNRDSAIAIGERYTRTPDVYRFLVDWLELAAAHKRLGGLYEQSGNVESAVEHYNEFVELWKDADPELQPQVEDVRRRIARLVGEPQH
jgi:tetratricopeptide (TPR) repeat protein